ncbi:hypothetical protein WA026_011099 [Henosepilachna vigintioctopunctata]|uniref:Uncharacterized protein n=1 Tax=Henosepilachna vigintioctopunctata TaxID=420089 RepID=A0AAW1U4R6_9CUCU
MENIIQVKIIHCYYLSPANGKALWEDVKRIKPRTFFSNRPKATISCGRETLYQLCPPIIPPLAAINSCTYLNYLRYPICVK